MKALGRLIASILEPRKPPVDALVSRTYATVHAVRCCVLAESGRAPGDFGCKLPPVVAIEGDLYCAKHAAGGLERILLRESAFATEEPSR